MRLKATLIESHRPQTGSFIPYGSSVRHRVDAHFQKKKVVVLCVDSRIRAHTSTSAGGAGVFLEVGVRATLAGKLCIALIALYLIGVGG